MGVFVFGLLHILSNSLQWFGLAHVQANHTNLIVVSIINIVVVVLITIFLYNIYFLRNEAAEIIINNNLTTIKTVIGVSFNVENTEKLNIAQKKLLNLQHGKISDYYLIQYKTAFFLMTKNFQGASSFFIEKNGHP